MIVREPLINDPSLWSPQIPRRTTDSNKYDFGHALIFGAEKMTGATRLAAEACARIGAGLTTVIAKPHAANIYRATLPPHIIVEDLHKNLSAHLKDDRRNAILIGPGAGDDQLFMRKLIQAAIVHEKSIVLDADGLNALRKPKNLKKGNFILTPHEGEFARLFPKIEGEMIVRARLAARASGAIVILKGSDTIIAAPDGQAVINQAAPVWLATAGTGDVLSGIITGLVAQGMETLWAASAAVWIHAECAKKHGPGLVANDLKDYISQILNKAFDVLIENSNAMSS